jgi:hypothetical protein
MCVCLSVERRKPSLVCVPSAAWCSGGYIGAVVRGPCCWARSLGRQLAIDHTPVNGKSARDQDSGPARGLAALPSHRKRRGSDTGRAGGRTRPPATHLRNKLLAWKLEQREIRRSPVDFDLGNQVPIDNSTCCVSWII